MIFEKNWELWANHVRKGHELPLRVELWNGRHIDFGTSIPEVIIRIPNFSALSYLLFPSIAHIGKAYVEQRIELEGKLHAIIDIGNAIALSETKSEKPLAKLTRWLLGKRLQNKERSEEAIQYHYDVSNEFYQLWLDKNMVYSCAYYESGNEDLETAQIKKIDHILKKIRLQSGQTLLDIGCGWGALVIRAAQQYDVKCIGITLSKNQEALARKRVFEAGLSEKVEIRLQDYRDVQGTFDRVTSVGMFEHVGLDNLADYFTKVCSLLSQDGVAMNHGITTTDIYNRETRHGDFVENYVFPHGQLPHISTVLKAMQTGGLEALDIENLRRHYTLTCEAWANNFETHAEKIKEIAGEKRFRIWRIYLAGCAYAFQHDWISLYQVVCMKSGQTSFSLPSSRHYMYQK